MNKNEILKQVENSER